MVDLVEEGDAVVVEDAVHQEEEAEGVEGVVVVR